MIGGEYSNYLKKTTIKYVTSILILVRYDREKIEILHFDFIKYILSIPIFVHCDREIVLETQVYILVYQYACIVIGEIISLEIRVQYQYTNNSEM